MDKKFISFSLFFLLAPLASASDAQEAPSPSSSIFCALPPAVALQSLEGTWSLTQGAGAVVAGTMTVPLPAHAPVPLEMDLDVDRGVIVMHSADFREEMVMFPASGAQGSWAANVADEYLELDQDAVDGILCEWDELPTFIGTNRFLLDPGEFSQEGHSRTWCLQVAPESSFTTMCEEIIAETEPGTLSMTIVLRFPDADHGVGTFLFDGELGGHMAKAWAPARLSRN